MKYLPVAAFLLAAINTCFAQTTETRYFKKMHSDEVDQKKAKFSKTIIRHDDGTQTVTWRDLERNEVVTSQRGDEPLDVWVSHWGGKDHVKDYNFTIVYGKRDCGPAANPTTLSNESLTIENPFVDDPARGYVAPQLASGEKNFMIFLQKNVQYPAHARRNGIQGAVYVQMTITKDGRIENIVVTDGIDTCLDKESMRVIRLLKLATPPMLNGQPVEVCGVASVKYRLVN